jgi:hypothetical protein
MFRGRTFRLLYRATDDEFGAADFHRLCDGCTNTLTVVCTGTGDIVGGYTPSEWVSACRLLDDSAGQTFVFTMSGAKRSEAEGRMES